MSDSECETRVPVPKKTGVKKAKTSSTAATSTATKRKPSTSSSCEKKRKHNVFNLFGGGEPEEPAPSLDASTSRALSSYIVNRVGNGSQRRYYNTKGEFYIELKVFVREDAENTEVDERWKKALLRLNCCLEEDSSQWVLLQRFVKDAAVLFEDAEPTFFSEKLNIKRPF